MLSNLPDINCPDLLVGLPSANLTFKLLLDVIDVRFAGIEPVLRDDFDPAVAGAETQLLLSSSITTQRNSTYNPNNEKNYNGENP